MNLAAKLESTLGAECVFQSTTLNVDGCRPVVTVAPKTYEEVAEVLRFADIEGLKVLPFGTGTRLHIGNIPKKIDIALSTARLNQVISYEPADLTAIAEAGVPLVDFFARTSANGQWLPVDPPGKGSTLGGVIATNAFGPLRTFYGTPRDYVIGLKIVAADGTLIKTGGRVVKNVAGYDLNKLFIGSFGTLGVIVETAFKLRPVPESESTCLITSRSIEPLAAVANQVFKSQLLPISTLLTDSRALKVCDVPTGEAKWGLLVRFGDNRKSIDYQVHKLNELVAEPNSIFQILDYSTASRLWQAIADFEDVFASEVTLRINTLPNRSAEMATAAGSHLKKSGMSSASIVHTSSGVVHLYIKSASENDAMTRRVLAMIEQLRAKVGDFGSLIIERAPLAIKQQVDVWGQPRGTAALMRGIKEKFDPKATLIPGRYVAGI
ncbi:MAG TPA: FAD-binding oxidoreductase [Blastocatellia bacterium]|nr:FAD-binding oxidoreductase [Blastocatellia bacterium]